MDRDSDVERDTADERTFEPRNTSNLGPEDPANDNAVQARLAMIPGATSNDVNPDGSINGEEEFLASQRPADDRDGDDKLDSAKPDGDRTDRNADADRDRASVGVKRDDKGARKI